MIVIYLIKYIKIFNLIKNFNILLNNHLQLWRHSVSSIDNFSTNLENMFSFNHHYH